MKMTQQRTQDTALGTLDIMSQYSDVELPMQTH